MAKPKKNDRLHLVIHSKITLSYLIGFLLSYLSYVVAGIHLETSFFSSSSYYSFFDYYYYCYDDDDDDDDDDDHHHHHHHHHHHYQLL